MSQQTIAIIGAGPGGYAAALQARKLGAKTIIIEKENVGGVCLNWGCIPTKALLASAELLDDMRQAQAFGIHASSPELNFSQVMERKNTIVSQLRMGMQGQLKRAGVEYVTGIASLVSPQKIRIDDKRSIDEVRVDKIIVATGSEALGLPFLPFDGVRVFDARSLLNIQALPQSMIIIGGGAIGCEFASMLNSFGVKVTLIEMKDTLLPIEDSELGKRLALSFKKRLIHVHTGTMITGATITSSVTVTTTQGDISADAVLVAIGRKRSIDNLGLESCGIKSERGTILVNDYLETSVPGVYAIGDVLASPQLAHVAMHEGVIAATNALQGNAHMMEYRVVPSVTFTEPEIATVGLTKDMAETQKMNVGVAKYLYSAMGKAHCIGKPEGFLKLVYDKEMRVLLGGQMMGASASDIIGEIALAIALGATIDDLAHVIHAHPTLYEIIQEAAASAEE